MNQTFEETIELRCEGKRTVYPCTVEQPTPALALKKALKVLGWTWFGAIASFVIPLLHWVTVPTGILMGPILARIIYKTHLHRATIRCAGASCPACGAALPIAFGSDVKEFERTCSHCDKASKVSLLMASSAAAPS